MKSIKNRNTKGRPKMQTFEVRDYFAKVRLNTEEYYSTKAKASQAGMTMSQYIRATLQNSVAATEAVFLLLERAFDELGYRRVQWSCDALNDDSRAAAERFGFVLEGVLRNHKVVKAPPKQRSRCIQLCFA